MWRPVAVSGTGGGSGTPAASALRSISIASAEGAQVSRFTA
ncbi:hypothetical protein [Nonomuraea dietziae]